MEHTAVLQMEIGDDDETDGIMNTATTCRADSLLQQTRISRVAALVVGCFTVIAVCLVILRTPTSDSSTGASDGRPPTESSIAEKTDTTPSTGLVATTPRACTLSECFASNCDHDSAPYTCLFHNGGPHGGCSSIVWTPESCTEQCDLTGCDDMDIPDDTPSCADQICTDQWCQDASCTTDGDAPFMCTDGSARYGCSEDKLQWTLRTAGTTCSSCCDVSLC